ncbi:hypothetical protein F7Q99_19965 [Streptomyces kaniharaensis]|uniref:Uncharacterized protein n=1 Tax=Streptomyces kaniharaensis TaxID=212423 RepID=A0A6N7KVY5_9ACTN|nr:hypothetical protein [Streptomyces kaniharaensis]MQS14477.1 hypothetical protein [Streptomyces kaniharaensis]
MSAPLVDVSVLRGLPEPADVGAVRVAVAGLVARVLAGSVTDVGVSPDGRVVRLQVASVTALSAWHDLVGRASGGVASRDVGGLSWFVDLPPLVELPGVRVELTAVSGEFEVLPRSALVRAMCPWMPRLWEIEDREAAAAARLEVAA